jgi:hypothetical protein
VIAGSGDEFLSTIFCLNLVDLSVEQIVQQGEAMPGGGTFGFVQRPKVSDESLQSRGWERPRRSFEMVSLHPGIDSACD